MRNQNVCPLVRQRIRGLVKTDPQKRKKSITLSVPGFSQNIAGKYQGLKGGFFRFPHLFFLKNKGPVSLINLSMAMTFHLHLSGAIGRPGSAFHIRNNMFFLTLGYKHFHDKKGGFIFFTHSATDDKRLSAVQSEPVSLYLSQPLFYHRIHSDTTHFSPRFQSLPSSVNYHTYSPDISARILLHSSTIQQFEKNTVYESAIEKVFPRIYSLVSLQKVQTISQSFPQLSEQLQILRAEKGKFHRNNFIDSLSSFRSTFLLSQTESEKTKSPLYFYDHLNTYSSFPHYVMNPLFPLHHSTVIHSVPSPSLVYKYIENKGRTRNYFMQYLREVLRDERFFHKENIETKVSRIERDRVFKESNPGASEHFYKNIFAFIHKHFPITAKTEGVQLSPGSIKIGPFLSYQMSHRLLEPLSSSFFPMSSPLGLLHIHPLVSSIDTFSFVKKYYEGNEPLINYYSSQLLKKTQISDRLFPQQMIKMLLLSQVIDRTMKESLQTLLRHPEKGIKSLIPMHQSLIRGSGKRQTLWSKIMSGPGFMQILYSPPYVVSHRNTTPQAGGKSKGEPYKIYTSAHSVQNREARHKIISQPVDTQLYFYNKEILVKEIEKIKEVVQETQKTILTGQSPSSYSPGKMDINHHINIHSLSEQVYQVIERKVKIENERRGIF